MYMHLHVHVCVVGVILCVDFETLLCVHVLTSHALSCTVHTCIYCMFIIAFLNVALYAIRWKMYTVQHMNEFKLTCFIHGCQLR